MKYFIGLLLAFSLLQLITADIYCNDGGICSGDGNPAADTRCENCHSCTYKNCCNVRFTNPYTKCNIPGSRSDAYNAIHG